MIKSVASKLLFDAASVLTTIFLSVVTFVISESAVDDGHEGIISETSAKSQIIAGTGRYD